MQIDFSFRIDLMTLLDKLLVTLLGLIGLKNNDAIISITSLYFLIALFDQLSYFIKKDFPG